MILDRRIIATSGGNGGVERRTGCVLFMRNVRTVYTQALLSLFVVIFHRILFSRVLQRLYPSWLLAGPLHGALVSADWWPQQGVYSCICLVGSRQSSLFFFLIISFFSSSSSFIPSFSQRPTSLSKEGERLSLRPKITDISYANECL